jgi:hypothetical protein
VVEHAGIVDQHIDTPPPVDGDVDQTLRFG